MKFWIWLKKQLINLALVFSKKVYIPTERVKKCDKNKDGYISLTELLSPLAEKNKIIRKIYYFVGKYITFVNVPVDRVLSLDENKDGKITANELWNYIKSLKK